MSQGLTHGGKPMGIFPGEQAEHPNLSALTKWTGEANTAVGPAQVGLFGAVETPQTRWPRFIEIGPPKVYNT
jgi:hypothetical protein